VGSEEEEEEEKDKTLPPNPKQTNLLRRPNNQPHSHPLVGNQTIKRELSDSFSLRLWSGS
jgi:hypothetical protein